MKTKHSELFDVPDIYKIVYELTSQIPEGMVSTYGSIAEALGDIKAARSVGAMEHENPTPIIVPCHRVVYADGGLSGFGAPGGPDTKKKFLSREGVSVRNGRIVGFEKKLFTDFKVPEPRPLEKLRAVQESMRKLVSTEDSFESIDTVCGIDVAYSGRTAFGAAVVIDYKTKNIMEKVAVETKVDFPYIPSYLAYRELPAVKQLMGSLGNDPTILLTDGNGILHPRRFGIASHIGVLLKRPTMGSAKKKLCGEYDESKLKSEGDSAPVLLDGEKVGYALKSSKRSKRPVFISPGHMISGRSALKVAKRFLGQRMLKPVKEAHKAADEKRRLAAEN